MAGICDDAPGVGRIVVVNLALAHRRCLARLGRRGASATIRRLIEAAMRESA